MLVDVFPGQGSQFKGMGRDLFSGFPEVTAVADRVLGYSIADLCVNDPKNLLGQTEYTQPAMYVVNALTAMGEQKRQQAQPAFAAGHSLGEYNALLAADVFDFETGLRLVRERAALMARVSSGGMAAVIGLKVSQIEETLERNRLHDLDIANLNCCDQIVLSGPRESIAGAKKTFESAGATMFLVLNVSAAFHSRYMKPISQQFGRVLESVELRAPKLPVISNAEAKPYTRETAKSLLANQISSPVRWTESVQYLLANGAENFRELGPGNVLTRLVQNIRRTNEAGMNGTAPAAMTAAAASGTTVTRVAAPTIVKSEAMAPVRAPLTTGQGLGSREFKLDYGVDYAYVAGAMYKGIASKELVIRMGKAGMLSFLGTGGMRMDEIESDLVAIQAALGPNRAYGMNLLCNLIQPELEDRTVDLFLKHGVRNVEAAAYMQMTPSLVRFRLKNIRKDSSGRIQPQQRIIGKVSRPEVAEVFLSPAPARILQRLVSAGALTEMEAELGQKVPVAEDICVEADSGGHTDQGRITALVPVMVRLRDQIRSRYGFEVRSRVGAAGGIGTPEAAAAAFLLGADFILTGSINQCTVEAGTSNAVKDMLQEMEVQDTAYCPAGDMFEIGAKIQVFRKGLFFPARANKLYDLYRTYNSLDEIDSNTKRQIEEKYFRRSFAEVWAETRTYLEENKPDEIVKAEQSPKHKMALIFRWYFVHTSRLAMDGDLDYKVDFQIHCGPALGAFNQYVKGTRFERWQDRHVDEIGKHLMAETAKYLEQRLRLLTDESETQ
jgi:trans-AT polyketide synthase/acyltransferase/oxidoreductase domain-containing protein